MQKTVPKLKEKLAVLSKKVTEAEIEKALLFLSSLYYLGNCEELAQLKMSFHLWHKSVLLAHPRAEALMSSLITLLREPSQPTNTSAVPQQTVNASVSSTVQYPENTMVALQTFGVLSQTTTVQSASAATIHFLQN